MKKCPNCGFKNAKNAAFCVKCGYQFTDANATNQVNGAVNKQMPNRPPKKSHHVVAWILVVVLLLATGGGYYWYTQKGTSAIGVVTKRHHKTFDDKQAKRLAKENTSLKKERSSQSSGTSSQQASSTDTTKPNAKKSSSGNFQSATSLSIAERNQLATKFASWAEGRAAAGNMALSTWYFDHGSGGDSDWTAAIPDGIVMVQNLNNPGSATYKYHALGGVVFYTAKDGTTGLDNSTEGASISDGYANADFSKRVSKYMLVDDGYVYQLNSTPGDEVSPTTGFTEMNENGPSQPEFRKSEDSAAQAEFQSLISEYHN